MLSPQAARFAAALVSGSITGTQHHNERRAQRATSRAIPHVQDDPAPVVLIEQGDIKVSVASAETLLATKIRASRGRRDAEDIGFLLAIVGIESVEAAIELYKAYYPEDPLNTRAKPLLKSIIDAK